MKDVLLRNFYLASENRRETLVSGKPVEEWLYDTYCAYNGMLNSVESKGWKEAIGVEYHINLTKHKISTLADNIKDMFLNSSESPFTIEPTPISELSKTDKAEVTNKFFKEMEDNLALFERDIEQGGNLLKRYQEKESVATRIESEKIAKNKALNMTRLMKDQLEEGGFRKEFHEFLLNFCLYPYAVFYAPFFELRHEPYWNGKNYVKKEKAVMRFKNISPFDYYWSKDTTAGGNGSFEYIRERMDITWLHKAYGSKIEGWIKKSVGKAIVNFEDRGYNGLWINKNPADSTLTGVNDDTLTGAVESLRCFGRFKGEALINDFDLKGLKKDEYYEVEAILVFDEVVYLKVNKHINQRRPLFTCSYRVNEKSVAGHTVYMMIDSLEKIVNMIQRMLLKNVVQVANPIVSFDINALNINDKEIEDILNGDSTITKPLPVNQSMIGGGKTFNVESFQNNIGTMQELLRYYSSMLDMYSGIPAMMHGTPQGSGANRTSSGIAMLYQQAIKQIQNAMMNLDMYFLEPFIKVLYDYNMQFHDNDNVKGDCKVKVRGSAGLILKEARKAESLEIIQVLSQFQNSPNLSQGTSQIIEKYVQEYLGNVNVDMEEAQLGELIQQFKVMEQDFLEQNQQAQAQAQQQQVESKESVK